MKGFSRPKTENATGRGTYMSYVSGFVLSIIFTLAAYFAVVDNWLSGRGLILLVTAFAILQLLVQLVFFLHLNRERRPRLNIMTFLFAALIVLVVVVGSLWIMHNLDYNMTGHTPQEIDQTIIDDEGIDTSCPLKGC